MTIIITTYKYKQSKINAGTHEEDLKLGTNNSRVVDVGNKNLVYVQLLKFAQKGVGVS